MCSDGSGHMAKMAVMPIDSSRTATCAGYLGIIRGNKVGDLSRDSHCNNNYKKKKNNKKNMRSPRIEPRIYGVKDHCGIHSAMKADGIYRLK